jgi:hypothetical protein
MKFRLGLLVCGAMLVAAAPVWADHAANPDTLKDFGSSERAVSGGGGSGFGVGATSDMGIHADSFSGAESDKFGYSPTTNWVRASRDGRFGEEGVTSNPAVAEPGSFPLILLGLLSVGLLVRRRGDLGSTGLLRE